MLLQYVNSCCPVLGSIEVRHGGAPCRLPTTWLMRLSSEVSRGSWGGRGVRGGGKGEGERDRSTIVGIVPPSPLGVYIFVLIDVFLCLFDACFVTQHPPHATAV